MEVKLFVGALACDSCDGKADFKASYNPVTFFDALGTGEPDGALGIVVGPVVYVELKDHYRPEDVSALGVK